MRIELCPAFFGYLSCADVVKRDGASHPDSWVVPRSCTTYGECDTEVTVEGALLRREYGEVNK